MVVATLTDIAVPPTTQTTSGRITRWTGVSQKQSQLQL